MIGVPTPHPSQRLEQGKQSEFEPLLHDIEGVQLELGSSPLCFSVILWVSLVDMGVHCVRQCDLDATLRETVQGRHVGCYWCPVCRDGGLHLDVL